MTPEQVNAIFQSKIKLLQDKSKTAEIKGAKDKKKRPDYNPIYNQCCDLYERMRVHTELDYVPEKLLKTKAPYEDEAQFQWRKDNIQPVTMPFFMRAMSTINRIFNKSNYSIKYTNEDQGKYFCDDLPIFGSIDDYAEQIIVPNKIIDPNGVVVIKPFLLPLKEEINVDESGNQVIDYIFDDSEEIQPIPVIYPCENIIDYVDGQYLLVLTEEKSDVQFGNKIVNEGLVYEFYDTDIIYKIKQIGKKVDYAFSAPEIYYQHNIGSLPVQKLKGIPKTKGTAVLYLSYFIYAIPNLDLAYYGMSNLDMSITSHIFPQKWEYVDRCDNAQCRNGFIDGFVDDKPIKNICPDCNGTGNRIKTGPMNIKTIHKPDPLGGTDQIQLPNPALGFVDPPTGSLEFTYKLNRERIDDAFAHLNIDVSGTNVKGGNNDTAKGKEIDREELFSFLLRISNEVFSLVDFIIDNVGKMRYLDKWEGATVSPPVNFAMVSAQDLIKELTMAKGANIPDILLRELLNDFEDKRFPQSNILHRMSDIVEYCDRLILYDTLQIATKLASNTVAKWEAILHDSIYTFILQEINLNPKFLDEDNEKIKDKLTEIAKAKETDIAPVLSSTAGLLKVANTGVAA